jgi:hypothetical protein
MDRLFNPDTFFTIPDAELLFLLRDAFAPELERLKNAYSVSDPNIARPSTPSPSRILYGADYDEVNRTLVSVLSLRWLHNSQYDQFVEGQPEPVRLTRDSFAWMRQRAAEVPADCLQPLLTAVIINDLGKDPSLAVDYHSRTGEDVSALNHDAILLKACLQQGMVAAFDRLDSLQRAAVIRGLELGADFNYGQLAQTENAPACLNVLRRFSGSDHDRRAVALHFLEQLLDISGAAGHMDWTSARKLIEPIAQAYRVSHDVVTGILSGTLAPCSGYDLVLTRRADLLRHRGFRAFDLGNADDRAVLRLMCMGGVADRPTADLYEAVWASLDKPTRQGLVRSLNLPGSPAAPAVLPTYMPALLTQAADAANPSRTRREKERGLRSALLYLALVMTLPSPLDRHYQGAIVVERNVLDVLKNVVQNPAFREDPTILERAEVPRGTGVVFDET